MLSILREKSAIQAFIQTVPRVPVTFRIHAYQRLLADVGFIQSHDIVFDNKNQPNFIALTPTAEFRAERNPYTDVHFLFLNPVVKEEYWDACLSELLDGYLAEKQPFLFGQMSAVYIELLQNWLRQKNAVLNYIDDDHMFHTFWMPENKEVKHYQINQQYYLDVLGAQDIQQVNDNWKYKKEGTEKLIEIFVNLLPTTCIREKATGDLVAHCLTGGTGMANNLFTDAKHRKKGLAGVVMQEHTKKLQELIGFAYCCIAEHNLASQGFFTSIGWENTGLSAVWMNCEFVGSEKADSLYFG